MVLGTDFKTPEYHNGDIEKHMDLPWDWEAVSHNPNRTYAFVTAHPDLPWEGIFGNGVGMRSWRWWW